MPAELPWNGLHVNTVVILYRLAYQYTSSGLISSFVVLKFVSVWSGCVPLAMADNTDGRCAWLSARGIHTQPLQAPPGGLRAALLTLCGTPPKRAIMRREY